jgi:hypothetical protein
MFINFHSQANRNENQTTLICNHFHFKLPKGRGFKMEFLSLRQIHRWKNAQNEYLTIYHAHMLIYLNKQFDKCPTWLIYIHILIYSKIGKQYKCKPTELLVTKLNFFVLSLLFLFCN